MNASSCQQLLHGVIVMIELPLMGLNIKIGFDGPSGPPQRKSKPAARILLATLVMAIILLAAALFLVKDRQKPAFSKMITATITFPWYYPDSLPKGAFIDTGSLSYQGGVILFIVKLPQGKQIVFNEQSLPPGGINSDFLKGQQQLPTNLGSDVQIKGTSPGFTGSLQTPSTLIIANTRDALDLETFAGALRHLSRY
jgi:hypothetical protein